MSKVVATFVFTLSLISAGLDSGAQTFELSKEKSTVFITGTSTLHNWRMDLKMFNCLADFVLTGNRLKTIENAAFECRATDLKSESSLMNKKAYSAMKSEVFPDIKYKMTELAVNPSDNTNFSENTKGLLTVAGKTNNISFPVSAAMSGLGGKTTISVKGETELDMSDFGIIPPVLMLGTLRTGNRIKVAFSLLFISKSDN